MRNHHKEKNPMWGKKHSLETRMKIKLAHKKSGHKPPSRLGIKHTKEVLIKIGAASKGNQYAKGNKFSEEVREHLSKVFKGKLKSIAMRIKLSKTYLERFKNPERHPAWLGGLSFEPYSPQFNKILKLKIKQRDNFQCQECYYTFPAKELHIHHIDYNKKNSDEKNLISLCNSCHMQSNFRRKEWQEYYNNKIEQIYA